jgi:NADH dehydrogenase [ubiquinone] 1 alpha subcomplex assembly factor 7
MTLLQHLNIQDYKEGDLVEISPESYRWANRMASHIHETGGCGLIVDYGYNHISSKSLRVGFNIHDK